MDPGGEAVLVGDIEDARSLQDGSEVILGGILADAPERLGEVGLAAPDGDIEGARVGLLQALDDPVGSGGILAGTDGVLTALGVAVVDFVLERTGGGVVGVMEGEVAVDLVIGG